MDTVAKRSRSSRALGLGRTDVGRTVAALLLVVVAGCSVQTPGSAQREQVVGEPVSTRDIVDATGGSVDSVAAAALTDISDYWSQTFPDLGDAEFTDIAQIISVDTASDTQVDVPCVGSPAEVQGNAFFCPGSDAMVYDRVALMPTLAERYGDTAMVLVLSHEVGHSVHTQLGIDPQERANNPEKYPTIVTESMADCYAGSFLRWVTDGNATHLRIRPEQLDLAVGSLVSFRDPVGTLAQDDGAHGNAFDRVSSFTDGYVDGPQLCAGITVDNRGFTQTQFTNQADADNGGNLPLDQLLDLVEPALVEFYTGFTGEASAPALVRSEDGSCSADQGPVALCPVDGGAEVVADMTELTALHEDIGDYASATLLAGRYATAALEQAGGGSGLDAVCLAGVFTRSQGDSLSPGDLDEAVQVLLARDDASRSATGAPGDDTGLDRVQSFRTGALDGREGCGLG